MITVPMDRDPLTERVLLNSHYEIGVVWDSTLRLEQKPFRTAWTGLELTDR